MENGEVSWRPGRSHNDLLWSRKVQPKGKVEIEPAHVIARTAHTILRPDLSLAHWTLGPLAVVKAKTATTTLLALRPLAIVRAKTTAITIFAQRPSAFVAAKI